MRRRPEAGRLVSPAPRDGFDPDEEPPDELDEHGRPIWHHDEPTNRRNPRNRVTEPAAPTFELALTKLSTVQPEQVRWVWPGYIALGKLNALDGMPDIGKSTVSIDIASRVTTGRRMPDGSTGDVSGAANVILLAAEDGLGDTVRPRVDAAGGDASRIHVVGSVIIRTGTTIAERWPSLADDLTTLEAAITKLRVRLVVVDVLMAYLGDRANSYRDQDMRAILTPMAAMAERTCCAVILLRHPTKSANPDPILSGGGSIGIIGAARVGLLAAIDPDDDCEDVNLRRRLLAVAKCNVGPKAPTMAYRITQDPGQLAGRVQWEGSTLHLAHQLVGQRPDADERDASNVLDELAEQLTDGAVIIRAADVEKMARANGSATRLLTQRLRKAGWRSKPDGFGGPIIWVPKPSDAPSDVSDAPLSEPDITDITDDITGVASLLDEEF
jgi:hypothetical protein